MAKILSRPKICAEVSIGSYCPVPFHTICVTQVEALGRSGSIAVTLPPEGPATVIDSTFPVAGQSNVESSDLYLERSCVGIFFAMNSAVSFAVSSDDLRNRTVSELTSGNPH